ncbi:MAG: hypothetical protein H6631_01970 [Anaerolineaceae bacterium]|nr:hypothetical protein [Anaerolineaceae bacterium]MCB9099431.1 hypothetical protein [Anaerolineales bacterium]
MMASLPTILLILAGLSLAATGIAALIAVRSQREAQSAIFPIVREEQSNRAQRARISIFVWTAVTALFLGGWLATLQLAPPSAATPPESAVAEEQSNQAAEVALVSTGAEAEAAIESNTANADLVEAKAETSVEEAAEVKMTILTPTATTVTQAPTAIPTETPIPPTPTATATPTPALGAFILANTGPRIPAPPGARIGPIEFASDITTDLEPVDSNDLFAKGVETIYAVFPFSGMRKGLDFTIIWYQNGIELAREEGEWAWGEEASSYTFLHTRGEGLYKLELYVNDTVVASDMFEIK